MIEYAFYKSILKSSLIYYLKPIDFNSRCLELSEKDGKTKCLKEIQYHDQNIFTCKPYFSIQYGNNLKRVFRKKVAISSRFIHLLIFYKHWTIETVPYLNMNSCFSSSPIMLILTSRNLFEKKKMQTETLLTSRSLVKQQFKHSQTKP